MAQNPENSTPLDQAHFTITTITLANLQAIAFNMQRQSDLIVPDSQLVGQDGTPIKSRKKNSGERSSTNSVVEDDVEDAEFREVGKGE